MDEAELQRYKMESLHYCNQLLDEINNDIGDINLFFGGELKKTYSSAVEKVFNKTKDVRTKIRNL